MQYKKQPEIRKMMRQADVNSRDLSPVVGRAPSTIGAWLSGWLPLPESAREKIIKYCVSTIAQNQLKGA